MAKNWTLDQLKSELSKRDEIKGWAVTQEHVQRRERYFMQDGQSLVIDQDRNVHSQSIGAKIMVKLAKSSRQGEIFKKLFPALPLREQIDMAIAAARETDHQAWELPTQVPSDIPELKTTDPRMAEDLESVVGELTAQIETAVTRKRNTVFNSAELFLSVHHRELHLSNGLKHRSSQSRIYTEAAYSFSRKNPAGTLESDEYLNTRWAVSLDELSIEKLFDETSDRAEQSLDVIKPETGKYSVIVDSEVLATLLNGHVSQLSGGNAYNGLPFIKPGSELIAGAQGDLITLTLDPTLEFGADTAPLSDQGLIQMPLRLVENNRVLTTATDKQHADYLGVPATTIRGNVVVSPGKLSYSELTRHAPKVIEILQFSGLFADPNSGTFSSEIRLARLFDNVRGKVTYLKGGSLSGSIVENFRGARFSSSVVKRSHFSSESNVGNGYQGPEYALLSEVSIVG